MLILKVNCCFSILINNFSILVISKKGGIVIEDIDLFSNEFLDFIQLQVQNNTDILEKNQHYKKFLGSSSKVEEDSANISDPEMKKLFENFIAYNTQTTLYENSLAFYLGLKTGTSISKLK